MNRKMAAVSLLALFSAGAAQAAEQHLNFVSCPILRDTATVPCWLSEYKGELYYLGIQQDASAEFYPPFLGHKVLAEGVVSSEPRICGGIVLKPNKVSVLPELAPECTEMRPERAEYQVPFAPRGPGPSKGGLAFAPAPGTAAARPPAPAAPQPPFQARTFTVPYDFDTPTVTGRTSRALQQAVTYARAIKASSIEVMGYRGQVLMTDGPAREEAPGIAQVRAQQVGELLGQVGIAPSSIKVAWKDAPEPADGITDSTKRRTTILVKP